MKKSVTSFVNNSDEDSTLLNSAPDLKEIITNLENGNVIGTDSGAAHSHCEDGHWICEKLLRFLSTAPGFYASSKSFLRLMNYILHLERQVKFIIFCLHASYDACALYNLTPIQMRQLHVSSIPKHYYTRLLTGNLFADALTFSIPGFTFHTKHISCTCICATGFCFWVL